MVDMGDAPWLRIVSMSSERAFPSAEVRYACESWFVYRGGVNLCGFWTGVESVSFFDDASCTVCLLSWVMADLWCWRYPLPPLLFAKVLILFGLRLDFDRKVLILNGLIVKYCIYFVYGLFLISLSSDNQL